MNTLIISYDLGGPETSASYTKLINAIRALGTTVKPLESFWLIKTTYSASAVNTHLAQFMDPNDRWMVLDVTIHQKFGTIDSSVASAVDSF